jgi:energy coupling factor transporter S component ThiW
VLNNLKDRSVFKLSLGAMFVACGVLFSTFYIPFGVAKCFPIQHLINIMGAVFLGPVWAVAIAFTISLLRNILGLGSILAFPGSMVGAFLAAFLYQKFNKKIYAYLGEVIGTGILGAMLSVPIAMLFLGKSLGIFALIIPFITSSLAGTTIAIIIIETSNLFGVLKGKVKN